ncbi:unnamed protein product [Cylindrotheca closterium]|uniref:GIY-YIG domain-containing protein n=1 Tax=Cylindrotheca closterium TaxID=2856 RepID=A0AAD2FLL0_9STRA|nr:unnamed protein product [Cylindrotheca closterium]
MQRKRKETSNDYIYRQDESSKKFASSDIRQKFTNFMFGLRKMSRYMVEKTTIYVLECENGKYYIGSTVNMKRRMQQHFDNSRGGSVWTRKYKPIRVVKVYKRIPYRYKLGFEAQVTAELMWEKGINNVRGAMYLYSREYNAKDIDSLVSFIGHYNDLSYTYVRQQLFKELSGRGRQVDNAKTRRKEQRKHLQIEYQKKTENNNHDDERYEASQCKDDKNSGPTTDTDDEDDTGDDRYKAMDAWLNRNIDEW